MTINCQCDRCGSVQDPVPRGYGFGKVGYNLCLTCVEKWENVLRNKLQWKDRRNNDWGKNVNKLLIDFVLGIDNEPEKVEFT